MSKKRVLEEDVYVAQLAQIIERDFFPELPSLRAQHALVSGGAPTSAASPSTALRRTAATAASVRSSRREGSGWDEPTPVRREAVEATAPQTQEDREEREADDDDDGNELTLDRFVATHTSEDNESFLALQEKAAEEHRKRYHWAFDVDEARGDPRLHLLADGSWISKEQRRVVDEVCAPKGLIDDRPSAPDSWKFRARNPLLFPPELSETRDICRVDPAAVAPLLLENGWNSRSGRPAKARKVTVYANSRFPSAKEELASTNAATATLATPARREELELVEMTPRIEPGVDATPIMTWGEIEGTPMILDARMTPGAVVPSKVE